MGNSFLVSITQSGNAEKPWKISDLTKELASVIFEWSYMTGDSFVGK